MRRVLVLLAGLAAGGCFNQKGPTPPYDAGHTVHFLVHADPPPRPGLSTRLSCRVGERTKRASSLRLPSDGFSAVEVAMIVTPRGEHRIEMADPVTGAKGIKKKVEVDRDLWVVLRIDSKTRAGKLKVYEKPPNDEVGRWRPLVPLTD